MARKENCRLCKKKKKKITWKKKVITHTTHRLELFWPSPGTLWGCLWREWRESAGSGGVLSPPGGSCWHCDRPRCHPLAGHGLRGSMLAMVRTGNISHEFASVQAAPTGHHFSAPQRICLATLPSGHHVPINIKTKMLFLSSIQRRGLQVLTQKYTKEIMTLFINFAKGRQAFLLKLELFLTPSPESSCSLGFWHEHLRLGP